MRGISRSLFFILLMSSIGMQQCRITRDIQRKVEPDVEGLGGMEQVCREQDTINNMMIYRAEAVVLFENQKYEATATLFVDKDSIIYISAVYGGFEILRASVEHDSIKVIDRMNRVVYRTPLHKRYGYQHPVNYRDLQSVMSKYFLCREMSYARDDFRENITFSFDEKYNKKRIIVDREDFTLKTFEFYHSRTNEYLMGEKTENGLKIYSNFMIGDIEINARAGSTVYNHEVDVKMEVNPNRYTFIELQ